MMESDFEDTVANSVEKGNLGEISTLARKIRQAQQEVEEIEKDLKSRKKDLLKLTDEELPSAMQELGMSSFSLDDGSTVDVKPTYGASSTVGNFGLLWPTRVRPGSLPLVRNVASLRLRA